MLQDEIKKLFNKKMDEILERRKLYIEQQNKEIDEDASKLAMKLILNSNKK